MQAVRDVATAERAIAVFPMTDASVTALMGKDDLVGTTLACPPGDAYESLSHKGELADRASALGVPVPRTLKVTSMQDAEAALASWDGRVVLKPVLSRFQNDGVIASSSVAIADGPDQALKILGDANWFPELPCLLQEYVTGHGQGIFTVYSRDGACAWFAHRRIREKPPSGGVSVLCESIPADPLMVGYAERLLDDAGWVGPAMVEFRVDESGTPWLMEVNGRFWGSLQLSIDCGLDFPWLWHSILRDQDPGQVTAPLTGRRLRWLLGDLDSLYLSIRGGESGIRGKAMACLRFLNFFGRHTRLEVLRLGDLRPFIRELADWVRSAFGLRGRRDSRS